VALRRSTEQVSSVTEDDLSRLQTALAGRVVACWDRLDDVISELVALHEIPEAEIMARVRLTIVEELEPPEFAQAAL
jgi:hypothetical protein